MQHAHLIPIPKSPIAPYARIRTRQWADRPTVVSSIDVRGTLRPMAETQTGVRVTLVDEGSAQAATGLPVLDHLIAELARTARLKVALEVAPGTSNEAVAAAGRAFGSALAELVRASGRGWAIVPAAEALASAALEVDDDPRLVSNVDFSDRRVGGVGTDVATGFLRELAEAARLNLHVRLLEGDDPQHVLTAIFKAVGAALGQACRPVPDVKEDA
jgi:imidazoleglycerol phosphate dehydratase HisB